MNPPVRRLPPGLPGLTRWVLLILLALLLAISALVTLASDPPEPAAHPAPRKFLPAALAGDLSDLALLQLDAVLERVSVDGKGSLVTDATTAAALDMAVTDPPGPLAPAAEARARFLLRKGLPGPAGEQLADLMVRYRHYLRAVQDQGLEPGSPPDTSTYEALTRLQAEHFGTADAQLLFGQRNSLMRAMLGVNP